MNKAELIEKWEKELEACKITLSSESHYPKKLKIRAVVRALTIIAMLVDVRNL